MLVRALPKVTRRDERAFRHDRVDQQAGGEVKDRCHGVDRDAEDHPNRRCLVTRVAKERDEEVDDVPSP